MIMISLKIAALGFMLFWFLILLHGFRTTDRLVVVVFASFLGAFLWSVFIFCFSYVFILFFGDSF